jgi:hypothetical protein
MGANINAYLSGLLIASVFGKTSAKIKRNAVARMVAYKTPP